MFDRNPQIALGISLTIHSPVYACLPMSLMQ